MLGLLLRLGGALLAGAAVGAAATVAVAAICVTISELISPRQIAEKAKIKCPGAIKAFVESKDTRRVCVGLFDSNNDRVGEMTIESSKGVSSSIYVGQQIPV